MEEVTTIIRVQSVITSLENNSVIKHVNIVWQELEKIARDNEILILYNLVWILEILRKKRNESLLIKEYLVMSTTGCDLSSVNIKCLNF